MELINHLVYIHITDATQQGKLLKYFSHKHTVSEGSQKQKNRYLQIQLCKFKKGKINFLMLKSDYGYFGGRKE